MNTGDLFGVRDKLVRDPLKVKGVSELRNGRQEMAL